MTLSELIEEYKELPKHCYRINYSGKEAVKKNNAAVARMYAIVETVVTTFGTEGTSKLAALLEIEDHQTNLWIATHLLEKVSLDKETEMKALSIIDNVAAGDDVVAIGFRYWLKVWNEKGGK